jgi:4-hydroxybenzoate polyprenyltransferase
MTQRVKSRVHDLLEMIKFSHTIFALPFALSGMLLGSAGLPSFNQFIWIVLAMVGARTAGMTWNRIADVAIDAKNPRTKERHLVTGKVSMGHAWTMTLGGTLLLLLAAWMLNPLCLQLSPLALAALFIYPFTKRFTSLCHYFLGFCLSAAPFGAYIAVTGGWDWKIFPLGLAVLLWVAGFDLLYALQDMTHDREADLHSLPKILGVGKTLKLAARLHIIMFFLLLSLSLLFGLGFFYIFGLIVVAALLFYEHSLLTPSDLTRLDAAFFTMNGVISVVVFFGILLNYLF